MELSRPILVVNILIAYIPRKANYATHFLSRLIFNLPKPRKQQVINVGAVYHRTGFLLVADNYVKDNKSGENKGRFFETGIFYKINRGY